jgi:spore coat protein JB
MNMEELAYDQLSFEQLKLKIQELEFAVIELNLFLDTHPDNEKALADFNTFTVELNKAKRIYERNFGPLTNFGYSLSAYPFEWI